MPRLRGRSRAAAAAVGTPAEVPRTGRDGIRIDAGVVEGQKITVHYDPLIAKLIAHGPDRATAIARSLGAIDQFPILGIRHNLSFLSALLKRPEVAANDIHTRFIEERLGELVRPADLNVRRAAAAVAARLATPDAVALDGEDATAAYDPWQMLGSIDW